jgi:hypothetical protein
MRAPGRLRRRCAQLPHLNPSAPAKLVCVDRGESSATRAGWPDQWAFAGAEGFCNAAQSSANHVIRGGRRSSIGKGHYSPPPVNPRSPTTKRLGPSQPKSPRTAHPRGSCLAPRRSPAGLTAPAAFFALARTPIARLPSKTEAQSRSVGRWKKTPAEWLVTDAIPWRGRNGTDKKAGVPGADS